MNAGNVPPHHRTLRPERRNSAPRAWVRASRTHPTVFTDPRLAGAGLTEDQQMERLGVCTCRTISLEDVPNALLVKRPEGLIKMAPPSNGVLMVCDEDRLQNIAVRMPSGVQRSMKPLAHRRLERLPLPRSIVM